MGKQRYDIVVAVAVYSLWLTVAVNQNAEEVLSLSSSFQSYDDMLKLVAWKMKNFFQ